MIDIEPIGNRIIFEPLAYEETSSGLVTTVMGQTTPVKGKVLKSGDPTFNPGDTIFLRRYSSDELKYPKEDGTEETLFLVESEDIVGVIRSKH